MSVRRSLVLFTEVFECKRQIQARRGIPTDTMEDCERFVCHLLGLEYPEPPPVEQAMEAPQDTADAARPNGESSEKPIEATLINVKET